MPQKYYFFLSYQNFKEHFIRGGGEDKLPYRLVLVHNKNRTFWLFQTPRRGNSTYMHLKAFALTGRNIPGISIPRAMPWAGGLLPLRGVGLRCTIRAIPFTLLLLLRGVGLPYIIRSIYVALGC